jgi:DNA-binding protein H-NS
MAKKAKRRGRPPGSKNKVTAGKSVATMDVGQLHAHIAGLRKTLAAKIEQQRAYFEGQLASLGALGSSSGSRGVRAGASNPRAGRRRKPEAKYRSKKNARPKWTGRGMLPVWMRDEMKGTKLKKEHFLIK